MAAKKHCVVIGAGLAGLAAAYYIEKEKKAWTYTVLEARERIGGRVFSFHFREEPTLVCELGGEWIGRSHDHMLHLCKLFGLKPIDHRFDYNFVKRGTIQRTLRSSAWPFAKAMEKPFYELRKQFKANRNNTTWGEELDRRDWWTVLRDMGFSEEDLLTRDLMDSTDFGESIRHTGGYSGASEYFEGNKTDEMDFRIEGGNTHLVNALAEAVGQQHIHTSEQVTQVIQKNGKIKVRTNFTLGTEFTAEKGRGKEGHDYEADACICTVPARTLRKIKFKPTLPDAQREAAEELQYARIMKTVLLFDERFWNKNRRTKFSCFTDSVADFMFDASLRQEGKAGILCSYAIGDKADDQASSGPEALQEMLEQVLSQLFPQRRTKAVAIHRYAWQRDEYSEGAYALYRPGQWFPVTKALKASHINVHFAGEHIADTQGFMEGAVDSGRDAARKLP